LIFLSYNNIARLSCLVPCDEFDVVFWWCRSGITSVINLQLTGEHASCGPGLDPSGFTYDPQKFMDSDSMLYRSVFGLYIVYYLPKTWQLLL